MGLLAAWLISGVFGITYLSLVAVALALVRAHQRFAVSARELLALVAPIALYLFLTHVIGDRQGFNWGYANLAIALPALVAVTLAAFSPPAYWIAVGVTLVAAVAAWAFVPHQGFTRLF